MDWLADESDDLDDASPNLHVCQETFNRAPDCFILQDFQPSQSNICHVQRNDANDSRTKSVANQGSVAVDKQTKSRLTPLSAQLKPTSCLPDVFRPLFKFGVFNAMQSQVYDSIMKTTANIVVGAPTGSGKTVLFELAVVRLLSEESKPRKCVYMAPTKALCSERFRDWTYKFGVLGIKCCELTGDTVEFNSNALGKAEESTIMYLHDYYYFEDKERLNHCRITTPEKFDSLSRNWRDNSILLSRIGLFLIDEVHILNDTRGSTLEVVTTRMKLRAALRFIVVSATVPNIKDIAEWIGNKPSTGPAAVFTFGDQYRPCRLFRFVYGFPRKNQNEFSFDRSLAYRILPLLQEHAENKPILIFCSTRKGTVVTAETLMKEYVKILQTKQRIPWVKPGYIPPSFGDQKLQELVSYGIGVHHAGLGLEDRRLVEELFIKKVIQVVVATSTLAVGVNLPAHTVVIKGVKTWQNGEWRHYSELDLIQMMGRAGRPQFDQEGVAIIVCDIEDENKYKLMSNNQTCIESSLHNNLAEHLNSEIGLRTITNLSTAKEWLHNSFLFHRIQKNSRYYALDKSSDQTWQARLDELVETSLRDLQQNELVVVTENDEYKTTAYGDIMSKFYIRLNTMKTIINLPGTTNIREILQTISNAEELSELRLRAGEKQVYRKLSEHNDIRFPTKVESAADKSFILLQAILGGLPLNSSEYKAHDSQPILEAITVLKHSARIARTIVEVALIKKHGSVLKAGMELIRSLSGKAWEDRPIVLRQIEHIGDKSIRVLVQNNIRTIAALRKANPSQLELLLNRRPPFGSQILSAVSALPQYCLEIIDTCIQSSKKGAPIVVELTIECKLSEDTNEMTKTSKRKSAPWGMTSILTLTNESNLVDFRRIPTRALRQSKIFSVTVAFEKPSQSVLITMSPDNFAGLSITKVYKPSISAEEYPVPNTKPLSYDVDEILAGLEEDPTFWQATLDDSDEILLPKNTHDKALTKKEESKKKFADPDKKSAIVQSKLPNGNYECNHTCRRKNQCRHLCCRDGVPRPSKRNTVKRITSKSHLSASQKPLTFSNTSLSPLADRPNRIKERLEIATESMDSEQLSIDEDLPPPDDILKRPRAVCGQDFIVIDDSDSENSTATGQTVRDSSAAFSHVMKRTAVSSPPNELERKRQRLHSKPLESLINNFRIKRMTETSSQAPCLFMPSSSDGDNEPIATISQPFVFEAETDDSQNYNCFNKDEGELDLTDGLQTNEEPFQPLDDYAKDYAELCAWLVDVTE